MGYSFPRVLIFLILLLVPLLGTANLTAAEFGKKENSSEPNTPPADPQPTSESPPVSNDTDAEKASKVEADADEDDENPPKTFAGENWTDQVVIVPLRGVILPNKFGGQGDSIINAIKKANKDKAKLLILEIQTPGGAVITCEKICRVLNASTIPTQALVLEKAISGGAMVATACDEIHMVKAGRIGDVQPMIMNPLIKIDARTWEKQETVVRAMMRTNADANGHPKGLMNAMVSRNIQLYEVAFTDGSREFYEEADFQLLQKNIDAEIETREIKSQRVIVEKGSLLTLTATEAKKFGLVKSVVETRAAFYEAAGLSRKDCRLLNIPAGEMKSASGIPLFKHLKGLKGLESWQYILLSIFLIIGVAGALLEYNTPGFGIPGACGIIGFACYFTLLMANERGEWYWALLFCVGIIFLVVEIVVLPGFGVFGLAGIACVLGALFLAFLPSMQGSLAVDYDLWGEFSKFVILLFISGVLSLAVTMLMFMVGHKLPLVNAAFHRTHLRSGAEVREDVRREIAEEGVKESPNSRYLNQEGIAKTALRPAGKVRLDSGEELDVITQGELIKAKTRVRVLDTSMNRIVVELAETGEEGATNTGEVSGA